MSKVSTGISNDFCPQTLFLYGTYREDGSPNFGLFCWFSYCWDTEMHIMACVGGSKLTRDRIKATGVFSANLVSRDLLPLADYFGNTEGYTPGKMDGIAFDVMKGAALDVPVLTRSPWSYELKVERSLTLDDGELFVCKVCNVLAEQALLDENTDLETRMRLADPVITTHGTYFTVNPTPLGGWGEMKRLIGK